LAGFTFRELQITNYNNALAICSDNAKKELYCMENALLSVESMIKLLQAESERVSICLKDEVLAYTGKSIFDESFVAIESTELDFLVRFSWDFLSVNETLIKDIKTDVSGDVHTSAVFEGEVIVGAGTRILPGVFIEGNVIFGKNCKIGPNCYIRGNTFIGDNCHIGQSVEIKNCIIMNGSSVGHLSYCGDSIIAQKVNFGAGTTTSNLRHDGNNHKSLIDGELVDTGRRKMGMIIGSDVHTGINTSFYPGRKIWPGMSTRPGDVVQRDIK
jgi:bifunctional UDP-N-acetylglucosamine pyrophosphorylase/glucosamine-1-phosphate N-acetyltransferase